MEQSQESKYHAAIDNESYCKDHFEYIQTTTLKFLSHQTEREKKIQTLMEMVKNQEEKIQEERKVASEKYQQKIIHDYEKWKKKHQ
jgi:hypothetical protein